MARIRGKIRKHGAVVGVAITRPSRDAHVERVEDINAFQVCSVDALLDTGSDVTLIHTGVAEFLGLTPFDVHPVRGVHNDVQDCYLYDVDLRIGRGRKLFMWRQNLAVAEVAFTHVDEEIRVILGRSALLRSVFTYNGGKETFSLKTPSPGS